MHQDPVELIIKVTSQLAFGVLQRAVDRAIYLSLRHAALSIRKHVRESIKESPEASRPGEPVRTRGGRGNVKNSIFADVNNNSAIIGPRYSFVGDAMEAHEFGKRRGVNKYEARPTMAPGLLANTDRFAESFRGSIGE